MLDVELTVAFVDLPNHKTLGWCVCVYVWGRVGFFNIYIHRPAHTYFNATLKESLCSQYLKLESQFADGPGRKGEKHPI